MAVATGPRDAFFGKTSRAEALAILGAMRAVAETGGASASDAAWRALAAAWRYLFRQPDALDFDALKPLDPKALAAALAGTALADDAAKFVTIMAFVDGKLDDAKVEAVLAYADALGVKGAYVDEMTQAAHGHVQAAMADMTRRNIESITGEPWGGGDAAAWLLPYTGPKADPALAARFEALSSLPQDSFGRSFWSHFRENGYAFPGEPDGLNAVFSVPHDSAHVLSGYDTHPRGELLVSTLTAGMHRRYPMAGHILPVIFSFQLSLEINRVARDASGALDPQEFWHAWAAGEAMTADTFAPDWSFWDHAPEPLAVVRRSCGLPPEGLDPGGSARAASA